LAYKARAALVAGPASFRGARRAGLAASVEAALAGPESRRLCRANPAGFAFVTLLRPAAQHRQAGYMKVG